MMGWGISNLHIYKAGCFFDKIIDVRDSVLLFVL